MKDETSVFKRAIKIILSILTNINRLFIFFAFLCGMKFLFDKWGINNIWSLSFICLFSVIGLWCYDKHQEKKREKEHLKFRIDSFIEGSKNQEGIQTLTHTQILELQRIYK